MEILNRESLLRVINEDKFQYFGSISKYNYILKIIKGHPDYLSFKYVKLMRKCAYYYSKRRKNVYYSIMYIMRCRSFFSLGRKLGIESGENVFESGLKIFHTQGIVINGNARVGKNCRLYGNNCIGNNGKDNLCPTIGNNARLCVGAKILGNVILGNNVVIAAGAVVLNSFEEDNIVLAGIPARIVARNSSSIYLE